MQVNEILGVQLQLFIPCEPSNISAIAEYAVNCCIPDLGDDIVQAYEDGDWVVWEDADGISRYEKIIRSLGFL
jgi:hypothetical protein